MTSAIRDDGMISGIFSPPIRPVIINYSVGHSHFLEFQSDNYRF